MSFKRVFFFAQTDQSLDKQTVNFDEKCTKKELFIQYKVIHRRKNKYVFVMKNSNKRMFKDAIN